MKMDDADKEITYSQAFDAMSIFLERYWDRGERRSDDLAVLLGSINRGNDHGMPLDQAQWIDWLEACEHAKISR